MGQGSDDLNPIDFPRDWDNVWAEGQPSPGYCELAGFKRPFGWEVKKGKGAKGSTVTLNEYPPAEGTLTLYFWEAVHFERWREFREIWNYDPTKKPVNAVDIWHPALADIDVTKVVCKDISALERVGGGYYKVVLSLIEYNPPPKKPANATPKGSGFTTGDTKATKGSGDPIADAQQEEIRKLRLEAFEPNPNEGKQT